MKLNFLIYRLDTFEKIDTPTNILQHWDLNRVVEYNRVLDAKADITKIITPDFKKELSNVRK